MSKVSKVRKTQTSGCLIFGFFGVFAIAGAAMLYFMTWLPFSRILAARGWTETVCEILSSRVEENRSSDGSTYRVDVRYQYQVDWETFQGDRYDFSMGSSSGYEGKKRVVDALPAGSETTCYVDPEDPARSVINREPGLYLLWGLFPLPFLAVGVGGLAFFLAGAGARRKLASKAGKVTGSTSSEAPRPLRRSSQSWAEAVAAADGLEVDGARARGPLDLESGVSPFGKILGMLFIALFWNGIVSVFLFTTVIPGIRSGDVEWFPTLFMIPFVLVGLGLIGGFFYQVLASFNPRPRLRLEEGHLTPGSETSLSWQFSGRSGRLQKLTLELEGRESARYRRGTKTYTDHHVFFTEEVMSEARFHGVHRGEATLRLPERTLPSFEAPNNKIEWRLKLRGDIPMWPDVIEDFTLTVYPS